MYESSPIEFHQQHAQLREAIESCPSFLCGDVVVIHQKGTITWGHAADIFDMTRETAVRGNLFLFNNPKRNCYLPANGCRADKYFTIQYGK